MPKIVKLESKRIAVSPCRSVQSNSRLRENSPLTHELKEFIDRAIVPALVAQYLAEIDLAKADSDTAKSDSSTAALEPRTVRP